VRGEGGLIKYAVEKTSGGTICLLNFIKFSSDFSEVIRQDTHADIQTTW
jgi:hypothetical protein